MSLSPSVTENDAANYYVHARQEVAPLIPVKNARILEIGCGAGGTIAFLKSRGLCGWAAGVEIIPGPAEQAKNVMEYVWQENIETFELPLENGSVDVILCLDVLEHLVDPWSVVKKLTPLLASGGVFIASIPNIRHYSAWGDIVMNGKFEYQDAGIMDRTHMRFFTRQSIIGLATCSGLKLDHIEDLHYIKKKHWWKPKNILKNAVRMLQPEFTAIQYLVRARKA